MPRSVPPARRGTVLVVEDDGTLRSFYARALMFAGYRAITAADGTEALHLIENEALTAVVLDLVLPTLSGIDVARELRSKEELHDIPIVVVTGTDVRDLDQNHFACVLRKPVNAETLADAIDDCVKKRRR
jgi:DNA-binding response OmpR family regulator